MKATEDLKQEHGAVLVALQILDKVAAAVAAQGDQAPAPTSCTSSSRRSSGTASVRASTRPTTTCCTR
jgi:hypothetical protein